MRRAAGVGLLLLSGVTLAGQPPPPRDLPRPQGPQTVAFLPPGKGVLRGRIVSAETGDPIRHARISTASAAGRAPLVLSDEQGAFVVAALPPGRFTLTATKAGYMKATAAATLDDGGAVEGIELRLTRGGTITGFVVDEFGDAGVDVSIAVERVVEPAPSAPPSDRVQIVAVAQTDDTGVFRISGLPPDSYVVDAMPAAHRSIDESGRLALATFGPSVRGRDGRIFYPGVEDVAAAQRIAIRAGHEKTGVSFVIPAAALLSFPGPPPPTAAADGQKKPPAVIRGHVYRPAGLPAAGARVMVVAADEPRALIVGRTGADGVYSVTIPDASDTRFRVIANKSAFTSTAFGQTSRSQRAELIALREGETRDKVDITLRPFAGIAGTVVDDLGEPVEGVVVQAAALRYVRGRRQLVVTGPPRPTDDLGRFRLFNLAPATYAVSASPGQIAALLSSVEMPGFGRTYFPGTSDAVQAQFVTVRAGEIAPGVDFGLVRARTFRVKGRASTAEGTPVTGGIGLLPSHRLGGDIAVELGARIEPSGEFEFLNVPPGEYVLQVVRNRSTSWNEGQFAYSFVTVADEDVTDLALRTSTGSSIAGRLTFVGGDAPRTNAIEIVAVPTDLDLAPRMGGNPARARITEDGQFEMLGISGPRRIQVAREPDGWMMKSVLVHGIDATDATMPFGRDNQSIPDVEITFTNQLTRIVGRVANPSDATTSDVAILAFATRRDLWYDRTRFFKRAPLRRDGSFTFEALPPEEYFVVAVNVPDDIGEWQDPEVLERLSRGAARVRIAEGQTVSVAVRLAR